MAQPTVHIGSLDPLDTLIGQPTGQRGQQTSDLNATLLLTAVDVRDGMSASMPEGAPRCGHPRARASGHAVRVAPVHLWIHRGHSATRRIRDPSPTRTAPAPSR